MKLRKQDTFLNCLTILKQERLYNNKGTTIDLIMENTNLNDLTKCELQDRLKEMGKKITGNKTELIERLRAGDSFIDDEALEGKAGGEEEEYVEGDDEQQSDSDGEPVSCLFFIPLSLFIYLTLVF